jgi:Spherulation-specific family 4
VVFALSVVCLGTWVPGSSAASRRPTISLSATPASITAGAASTLRWSTTGATACTASGSWSGSEPVSGSTSTGPLLASATYTLTCTGAGGRASAAATTVSVAPAAPKVCQSVSVPAYFYPSAGGLWGSADAAAPGVGIMVANVANGPGTAVNSDYASAIAAARAAGVRVFGYVYTHYGAISAGTVEASISAWKTLYGVTSIFVDEASTSSSELSYYQTLSSYVHAQAAGAQTIVNFGTVPAQSEMNAGDILVTFEGSYATYGSTRFPSWTAGYAPSRFYNIVYNVPDQLSMLSVLREAASAGVGQIDATSDVLPNPYDTLPHYLTAESSQARSSC